MDRIQTTACQSRHQRVPAVVCQHSIVLPQCPISVFISTVSSPCRIMWRQCAVRHSCFFQLSQLRTIRSSLTTDAAKTLAQAFVGGRLDYCNSILYGVSEELLRRRQSIQNAAARFITGTRKYDHITPVLRNLHWLPVRQRIIFKIATLMYRCLNRLAPSYLAAATAS